MKVRVVYYDVSNVITLTFNGPSVMDAHRVANNPPFNMRIPEQFGVTIDGEPAGSGGPLHEGAVVKFLAASS